MDEIGLFLSIVIAGLSLLLFVLSVVAYRRLRAARFLMVGCAFLVFTIKGILLITEMIMQDNISLVLDCVIILLLYGMVTRK